MVPTREIMTNHIATPHHHRKIHQVAILYSTFMDFEKAFDSMDRDIIWKLIASLWDSLQVHHTHSSAL
jgi:hypothetical protein